MNFAAPFLSARLRAPTALLVLLSLLVAPLASARTPIINYDFRFLPEAARSGMVVGPEQLASDIGVQILQQGGNAVDAAVATGFALAVTYPKAGNLGGGGFMLIHLAETGEQVLIDYRETAPAAAGRDMFLKDDAEVDRQLEYFSRKSAGVPGTVAGLLMAQERYGKLSRRAVLAPAIKLAKDGFAVSYGLSLDLQSRAERLQQDPEAARIFYRKDGSAYAMGDTLRQPDLARTLKAISRSGRDGFYSGKVAQRLVADMEANDGLITAADLAAYRVVERQPVRGTFRGYDIVSTPPPSSGGVHIIQMLNILEPLPLQDMGHNSAAYIHYVAEAMKLAYADRSQYLADPDFYPVPVARLVDKAYAARLRDSIDPKQSRAAADIRPGAMLAPESPDTTHYSVADADGNVVSNTYTLNFSFGSHIVAAGTGVLLNNEMADFAAKPGTANAFGLVQGEANRIEPGKRPLSSMTPTMVLKDGKPVLVTGSPGGGRIITAVLQVLLNTLVFDMNVASASAAPRVHHQWLPDTLTLEQGVSPDTSALLQQMGHSIKPNNYSFGHTQTIKLRDGWLFGATDPRRPGGAVAGY